MLYYYYILPKNYDWYHRRQNHHNLSLARRMSRGKSYLPTHTVKSFRTNVCCVTSDKSAEFLKSLCPALRRLSQIGDGSLLVRLFEVCVVLEPQLVPGAHLHDWPVIVHFHGRGSKYYGFRTLTGRTGVSLTP